MQTSSHIALEIILRKSESGKRSISFLVPSILNELSNKLKLLNTAISFTPIYKQLVLTKLE